MISSSRTLQQRVAHQLRHIYDHREAEAISFILLEDIFSIRKADVLVDTEVEVSEALLEDCMARLLQHEPIQYVVGSTLFLGRKFNVTKEVLIPRPETEELVQLIIDENEVVNPRILDIGVGSGCIALSLGLALQGQVYGTDVSEEALAIADTNARALGVEATLIRHDVLESDPPVKEADILVSNPPYIPQSERTKMQQNVLDHEPGEALFVPDDDPLLFYRRISEVGTRLLRPSGKIYFEIHEHFGQEVVAMLNQAGYSQVTLHRDLQGKDRMISAIHKP